MFKKHYFDIGEFKKLGDKLSNEDKEGCYRTAISRYYYYVYLKIRDTILKYDEKNFKYFKNSSSHRLLTSYLKALDDILNLDGELEVIANYLSNLRELRNIADYETSERVRAC